MHVEISLGGPAGAIAIRSRWGVKVRRASAEVRGPYPPTGRGVATDYVSAYGRGRRKDATDGRSARLLADVRLAIRRNRNRRTLHEATHRGSGRSVGLEQWQESSEIRHPLGLVFCPNLPSLGFNDRASIDNPGPAPCSLVVWNVRRISPSFFIGDACTGTTYRYFDARFPRQRCLIVILRDLARFGHRVHYVRRRSRGLQLSVSPLWRRLPRVGLFS